MKEKKITVVYICHDGGRGGSGQSLYNLVSSVQDDIIPIVLMSKGGPLASQFEKKGVKVLIFPFKVNYTKRKHLFRVITYPIRRLRDFYVNNKCVKWTSRQLSPIRIDIVHTNSCVISFGGNLAKALRAKHIWHLREFMNSDHKIYPIVGFRLLQAEMLHADATIAISKAVYRRWNMQCHHCSFIIPDAVRSVNDCIYSPLKEKYVLFCSSVLSDNKGANKAVEVFCRSRIYDMGYRLYYAGKYAEEYRLKLESIASEYGQRDALSFLGYQSDIKQYMSRATAFMMCSECEGLGRVTIEAMFYGCPVLANDSGGTKEIIEDGRNGMLYDNVEDAAEKLCKLIVDKPYSEELIECATKDAKENYSEEVYGKKVVELYRRLLHQ